ncbi:MAG: hypothetical protein Kow0092_32150 [Deferrisomatales bacterium]
MSRGVFVGIGRLLPEDVEAFDRDVAALGAADGFVFLDPTDGVHPVFLAQRVRRLRPDARVIVPLVGRDVNRTGLLAVARAAQALGAAGLLLLSGRLDPANPARTVYEIDPLQMLGLLREARVGLEAWVSSRCATAAERARAESLARAGAVRCVIPWEGGPAAAPPPGLAPVFSVDEARWQGGAVPEAPGDLLLEWTPGRGPEAAALLGRLRGAA